MKRKVEEFDINPTLQGMAQMCPPVQYSQVHGDCLLYLITPWKVRGEEGPRQPLILFVQGSGWTHANAWRELPQLSQLARQGYTVASVVHRNAEEGYAYPAYLSDVKTALRFLRAHAGEYNVDPARVCVWGTSSGGNTALLMGLTGDEEQYKTEEYAGESDAVQAVIDCFGPADIPGFIDMNHPTILGNRCFRGLVGANDPMEVGRAMSPLNRVKAGRAYPPFLILHGDADSVVPYEQSAVMAERLDAAGADVTLGRVRGGEHEGNFWTEAIFRRIAEWLAKNL